MRLVELNTFEEWMKWREGGLGSSDAPPIMKTSPWTTRYQLWARRKKLVPPQPRTPAMKRGADLELLARRAYEDEHGIAMPKAYGEQDVHPWIRASLDGYNPEAGRVLEIKCPRAADHQVALGGMIPGKYLWQCVHLLLVSGLPRCDYYSFDGRRGKTVTLWRDARLEKRLFKSLLNFWQHLAHNIPPEEPTTEEEPVRRVSGIFTVRRSR